MMSRNRFDDDDDLDERKDTEITLGLGSLLGIFFALVLLCGLFFGFGYTLGRGRSPLRAGNPSAATPEAPPAGSNSSALTTGGTKPAAQEAAPPPAPAQPNSTQVASTAAPSATASNPAGAQTPMGSRQAAVSQQPAPQAATPEFTQQVFQSTPPRTASQVAAAEQYMVQVAAVSRPQDANVLIAALQQRGFHATARTEAQDHLMHIQIGPFANLAAANQVRSRLMADGYNAILKR